MVLERHRTIDEIFPELYDIGPVSQTMCSPLYQYIHDTFIEAVSREGWLGRSMTLWQPLSSVQRDALLRVGKQVAQLSDRGDAWAQQLYAAPGGDRQDDVMARQGRKGILKYVTTKAIYISRM